MESSLQKSLKGFNLLAQTQGREALARAGMKCLVWVGVMGEKLCLAQ